ncbi:MAG: GNAT family N-acetyltransferase [Candidatus Dormibacteraeota bacterium]|nr:GNAT family N-acetyltransferase [Candidatus Dormibacteraeota bacterium]
MSGGEEGTPAGSTVAIEVESFTSEAAAALTAAQYAELRSRYGPFGAPHPVASDFEEPHGVFLVARRGDQAVACGGVRFLEAGVAEIRRMYTVTAARRLGIGARLLVALERHARRLGYRAIRLETGWLQPEALGLYERAGYLVIPCYGEFNDQESVCMEKVLARP